jgi:DNA polymerase III epsilon subunit family exonuclease
MEDTHKKLSETSFCALDLETTGTNAGLHMIVEVGIVRFTMGGIVEIYESLVNPGVNIPEDVIAVHGITDEMVRNSPRIGDILDDIMRVIRDSILVIHNPGFDLSFLGWAFHKNESVAPVMQAVDTVRLSRLAWPGLGNYKLETVCENLRLNISPHRALPDALACMEVFKHAVKQQDKGGRWTIADLIAFHGNLIRFIKVKGKRITTPGKKMMGLQLGEKVSITYLDQEGSTTVRTIHPREFITIGSDAYVLAYCSLRGDTRYFKLDRIIEINSC